MSLSYFLIGHASQKAQLERDLASNSVAHAYLISGPAHIGKSTIAKWFARALLCESQGCGTCASCVQCTHDAHPDLHVVRATDDTALSIDQARDIAQWMLIARLGRWKVCIIEEVDRMSHAALQAMLKTLEEPSPGTVFIMTTVSPARLPATFVSRARHIPLRIISATELQESCESKNIRFTAWNEMHSMIDGRPGKAVQFFEDPASVTRAMELTQLVNALLDSYDTIDRLQLAKEMADDESSVREFLYITLMVCRQRIIAARTPQERVRYFACARAAVSLWKSLATSASVRLGLESTMLHL